MTEENEGFLQRWSRRKRHGGAAPEPAASDAPSRDTPAGDAVPKAAADTPTPAPETVDLSDLPSINEISADTDVRGFLRPGVPPEMTQAALRRAWSSDPLIRDFKGLAENDWDFNDPEGIAGFGRIAAEEVARLLDQAVGVVADAPAGQRNDEAAEEQRRGAVESAGAESTDRGEPSRVALANSVNSVSPTSDDADMLQCNKDAAMHTGNQSGQKQV